jgi:hypothetical protein
MENLKILKNETQMKLLKDRLAEKAKRFGNIEYYEIAGFERYRNNIVHKTRWNPGRKNDEQ